IGKQIIIEKMKAELRALGFTNEELSKLRPEPIPNLLASCRAGPVEGFACLTPSCDLTSSAHRKAVIEFWSLPVEDLGEGITLDHLQPPEDIEALQALGYTGDAIGDLSRKQVLEILAKQRLGSGPNISGIPFLITQAMKAALRARGLTDEAIAQLTPKQAHEILAKPDSREVREFLTTIVAQARAATKHLKQPGLLQMLRVHPLDDGNV